MSESSLIDLKHLERYVAGDRALRDEVLELFEEQARKCVDRLDPDMADEDWRDVAHALKGAARGVGAWRLGALSESAEALAGAAADVAQKRAEILKDLQNGADAVIEHSRRIRAG